jgi:AAA+ ATPase superfamily predicted ATPase
MSAASFIGRTEELARLDALLREIRGSGTGRMVAIRGRRQVGKSRLVEEFIHRSGAQAVFYTASRQSAENELRIFGEQIAASSTEGATLAAAGPLGSWEAALTVAATGATRDDPRVIVLDELPFLVESVEAIEGILQKEWDRRLERQPVLVILVGSDVSTMQALSSYGRPLYGRVIEMVVRALSPAAVAVMLALDPHDALDAYLVIGGFPRLAGLWRRGDDVWRFLRRELGNPESSLVVLGERSVNAEFPGDLKAREILEAIGSGERTFTTILRRANVSSRTLETSLATLIDKRVIDKALPYSADPRPKLSRYTIADSYLRFWHRFIRPSIPAIERGRGDVVYQHVRDSWQAYAGRAIEPIVRGAILSLLPDERFGEAAFVGGFWNRDHSIEVDLVGGRDASGSDVIDFVGSIKWRLRGDFTRADLGGLVEHRAAVPGATQDTRLVGVARHGFVARGLDVELEPEQIVAAYAA